VASSDAIGGDAATARSWVEQSSLSEIDKGSLLLFIDRFPTLTFYKEGPLWLDRIEENNGVTLPRHVRTCVQTLAYVMPNHYVRARFDRTLKPGLEGERLRDRWYLLGYFGYTTNLDEEFLGRMRGIRPFPVGEDEVGGRSTIAINLADLTDERVYEYSFEVLLQESRSGYALEDVVKPMFASYADMFAHIDALKMLAKADIDMVRREDWPEPTIVEARG